MKIKVLFIFGACLLGIGWTSAQELSEVEKLDAKIITLENSVKLLQKFNVSGFIQAQYQWAQTDADGINFKLAYGRNTYETRELKDFGRFGIRRGRIKFSYEDGIASAVIQIDVTEKGINSDRNVVTFKDVYLQVKDPWFGTNVLKAGIFDRPFGYEIAYSSSRRESPERARITQTLFPDERDLGVALTLQPAKSSPLNLFKLEGGMFAGNGIKPQYTTHMDFIGHLSVSKQIGGNIIAGGGVSAYLGGVMQVDSTVFTMQDKKFIANKSADNLGKFAKRRYIGFDAQLSITTAAGLTYLRGEYIFGEHPGAADGQTGIFSFKQNGLPAFNPAPAASTPAYMRKISGGYVILVQDLGKSPFSAVVKYDWYNPNSEVSGNDIAAAGSGTTKGDIKMSDIGLGIYWRINPALRLTAYYDIVKNETTANLKETINADGKITAFGWDKNRKDNVFTLRLQYKF